MYFSFQKQNRAFSIYPAARYTSMEPHLHTHIELVFLREGGIIEAYADNKSVILERGDLFLAFPNQVHYYKDLEKPIKADIFLISPAVCPEFKKFFENVLPESPVFKNAKDNSVISSALNILLTCAENENEFSETTVRGGLLVLLGEYFSQIPLKEKSTHNTDTAKDIISFCYHNYMGDISLSSIAEALHISRYYVSHLFSKRLNVNFNEYINSLRIRKACELLKSGSYSITEAAHTVGYNSVRTFDRCFVKIKGITPREYRAKALEKKRKSQG